MVVAHKLAQVSINLPKGCKLHSQVPIQNFKLHNLVELTIRLISLVGKVTATKVL